MKKVIVSNFVARKFDVPCEVIDKDGRTVGVMVDADRFKSLTNSGDLGTCGSHMSALLAVPGNRRTRAANLKKLLARAETTGGNGSASKGDKKRHGTRLKAGRPRAKS